MSTKRSRLLPNLRCTLAVGVLCATVTPLAAQGRKMRVVDSDAPHTGVQSEIFLIDGKDASTRIAATDAAGYFSVNAKCEPGFQIRALPNSKAYYANKIECVAQTSQLPLQRRVFIDNLKANAKVLEGTNQTWEAALIYNELAARLATMDAAEAQRAKQRTLELVGSTVGVEHATKYDPQQEKVVMTPELKAALEAYQKSVGVAATGVVDYRTLTAGAEKPISSYMYKVISTE